MPRKQKQPANWNSRLSKTSVAEKLEEAKVDAYGEHEEHAGLLTLIEENLKFPFRANVIGETVTVVGMGWPEGDAFGLDLICERNGKRHRVDARSVELISPLPDGHLYLAAYLDWKRSL